MVSIPKPQRERTKHFFKAWREHIGLTQEQAMGRLGWSQSKISRIESGKTPYNQDDIEAAAVAYACSTTDILAVDPSKEGDVVDLLALLRAKDPKVVKAIIAALPDKTGTGE